MKPFRRAVVAAALSGLALAATVMGSAAHASAPTATAPTVAQPHSDYGICVGNAPVWFLNFCAI